MAATYHLWNRVAIANCPQAGILNVRLPLDVI